MVIFYFNENFVYCYFYLVLDVVDIIFFVADSENPLYIYESFNQYCSIQHFIEPINYLFNNIKKLEFREKKIKNNNSIYIGHLKINKFGVYKAFDVQINAHLEVLNRNKLLCSVISNKLKAKLIFKVMLCKLFYYLL